MTVHELKAGQYFKFHSESENRPKGRLRVIKSWGVQFAGRPPSDPWTVLCMDEQGEFHVLIVPAATLIQITDG